MGLGIGTGQLFILLAVGVLLFGSRLPDVAKSIGRSIFEFKKGLNDMGGNEIKEMFNFNENAPLPTKKEDIKETTSQKFEPPPEESAEPEESTEEADVPQSVTSSEEVTSHAETEKTDEINPS